MSVATKPQVVIVGGGFGGLACARKLDGGSVDALLVDGHNYHLFTPLLYQVATALLNPSDIVYPFRTIFQRSPNVRFRQPCVTRIDLTPGSSTRVTTSKSDMTISCSPPAARTTSTGIGAIAVHHWYENDSEALRLLSHVLAVSS